MKPGKKLFLTSNGKDKSGLMVPIIGNTIYMGNTEITATENPLMTFDSSPRNEPCSLGLTTIDKTINTVSANSKSLTESLKTVWRGDQAVWLHAIRFAMRD